VGVDTTVNHPEYKLEWKESAGKSLKRPYGSGSERTMKRRRRHQRELEQAAANTRNIVDIFKQQQGLKAPAKRAGRSSQQLRLEKLNRALDDLDRLIKSSKALVRTYGHIVVSEGDFDRRYRMVRAFLHRQKNKDRRRCEMAMEVAKAFGRSKPTARNIIKWEEWIAHRRLPKSKAGKHRACMSLLDNKRILCAIQDLVPFQKTCPRKLQLYY
jgi:predicted Zn-dependent protease